MSPLKRRITWKSIVLPIAGVLAFFLYLYLFSVDIPAIIETVQSIDLSLYLLSILLVFVETFFYALSWQRLLSPLSVKLSVVKANLYVLYASFMDVIVPAASITGEVSKLYLITREQSGTGGKVIASLVIQRLISIGAIMTSLVLGVVLISGERQVTGLPFQLALFLALSTISILIIFVLLCFMESLMQKTVDAVARFVHYISRGRWDLRKTREDALEAVRMFRDSMKEFGRSPRTLFAPTLFVALWWLSHLSIAYLVLFALGFPTPWAVIFIACSIAVVLPARVLPEIAMTTILTLLGVPPQISATATILTRILTFWLRFFLGFLVQQWLEIKAITAPANIAEAKKT